MGNDMENRTEKRILLLLEFLMEKRKLNPDQETFIVEEKVLKSIHPLLNDDRGREIAFAKIVKDASGAISIIDNSEKIKEVLSSLPPTVDPTMNATFHIPEVVVEFHIDNDDVVSELINTVKSELAKVGPTLILSIDDEKWASLTRQGANRQSYRMKRSGGIYKLVDYLLEAGMPVTTHNLALYLGKEDKYVSGLIEDIKSKVALKLGVPRNWFIENKDDGRGYRVINTIKENR